ncbi:chitin synthase 4 [Eremomyces bilateralis CBS 781.70]|uniref:chitin synthase n=1 Tax=Eremomyces bilateralis CBS 781.70 TaxID=1392243 RepID=A0A6G1FTE1_9PEZI|nr:chitin synthase 4 [Eremomyces bilateralis CBS 781.70]KAF1808978.1 chitin synthase 4 [Eremomyces bilateralis CBS 781.70]
MATPHHHAASAGRENTYRESPSRRRRPSDLESRNPANADTPTSPTRGANYPQYSQPYPSPGTPLGDQDPMMTAQNRGQDFSRKRSLIRPERNRIDRDHPNYHYRKHAQNMAIYPSTTGNDPIFEDHVEAGTVSSDSTDMKSLNRPEPGTTGRPGYGENDMNEKYDSVPLDGRQQGSKRLKRKMTKKESRAEKDRQKEILRPPSLWNIYCGIITFWAPDAVLKCFGMPARAQQRAWREKIGLISIILSICAAVGFLTFGFTQTVCPPTASNRMKINKVDAGFMILHGQAYDLSRSHHQLARGVPDNANVLFDLPEKHGGKDGSFLFQNVNGACKGLITPKPNSGVPTDGQNMGWYFPCRTFNQDGSSEPNITVPYYNGYSCHTSNAARDAFYSLNAFGDVYFEWSDIKNSSRNLMVWSGDVLDLNLINWFNRTAVNIPPEFDALRTNPSVRGVDVTRAFMTKRDKHVARCLTQIVKVGTVASETVGCIASKVVLYVLLVFILSIVGAKFVLAMAFQWFICHKYSAKKTSLGSDSKKRKQQIEDWSEDIYRAPPRPEAALDRTSKRGSTLFPTTSRFTSPYAIERSLAKTKAPPTTMTSQTQGSGARGSMYRQGNQSQGTLPTAYYDSQSKPMSQESRASLLWSGTGDGKYNSIIGESEGPGPAGFIHEAVVPQPPAEWQPFGYPLAHAICLVTAYSEGADSIRTTLDSVATTDYPNSHKLIFVVCDGLIKGHGESQTTPDIILDMMKDNTIPREEVLPYSYVAVASGTKRHSMAKIYSGFYNYGQDSRVPTEKQQRVPMLVVVKTGTEDEATNSKPGNRGKRDSQIILMSFLQKVMFDERMTELEFEIFNGIWKITGISPDFYEVVLMVDADTTVFPDSLTHMISAMVKDPHIMGLCGETKIANKRDTWVTIIQVFEYFISHHLSKSFESVFGGVTCLPGCFCMYRIKAPKGGQNYWVPILANPDVVEHYSENVVDTLHKKNLLLLGEDRYLSTLMLKTFPKRKQVFIPQAVCKTTVPEQFKVLLSQRRRWINSTVHNLMELVLVRDLCGTFCFSMQFVVFIELVGTLVLPAAISFTIYLIAITIKAGITHTEAPLIPLILLALILGLPGFLIVLTASRVSYVLYMLAYLISLPIWNFVLPTYAYWKFDDFSWGETRKTAGEKTKKAGIEYEGEFDSSKITMKRWGDFEQERRLKGQASAWSQQSATTTGAGTWPMQQQHHQQQHQGAYEYYD